MKEVPVPVKERFRRLLDDFVFFHLGSDARLRIEEDAEGLRVHVEHHRVEPFGFHLSGDQLRSLDEDPQRAEDFLLEKMTAHRR